MPKDFPKDEGTHDVPDDHEHRRGKLLLSSRRRRFLEAQKLLELAEHLQDSYDASQRRIEYFYFVLSTVVVAIAAGAILLGIYQPELWDFKHTITASTIVIFYLAMFGIVGYRVVSRYYRKRDTDILALNSIVDMLRETERAMVAEKSLSTLEQAEFRIRLSRFGIGTGASILDRPELRDAPQSVRRAD